MQDLRMKLQKERQATQAAEAKAEEAEAKMREAQAAVAQSADAALAQVTSIDTSNLSQLQKVVTSPVVCLSERHVCFRYDGMACLAFTQHYRYGKCRILSMGVTHAGQGRACGSEGRDVPPSSCSGRSSAGG